MSKRNNKKIHFYTICDFMYQELGLKGAEKEIYAIVYSMGQGGGTYNGSTQALADVIGISKRQVIKLLQQLVDKGLLIKKETYKNKLKYCEYIAVRKSGEQSSPLDKKSGEQSSPQSGEQSSPNNKYINKLSKKERSEPEKQKRKTFNQIIDERVSDDRVKGLLVDYIQMRANIGKRMTNKALELTIEDLFNLSNNTNEQIKILEKSIKNSWVELYPLKPVKEVKKESVHFEGERKSDLSELEKVMFGGAG